MPDYRDYIQPAQTTADVGGVPTLPEPSIPEPAVVATVAAAAAAAIPATQQYAPPAGPPPGIQAPAQSEQSTDPRSPSLYPHLTHLFTHRFPSPTRSTAVRGCTT